MGDGRTSKLASQDIGAPFSRGYPLFSHPQAPTGTLLLPITSSTFSLALSLPSYVPGLPSPLFRPLPNFPLSIVSVTSPINVLLPHSLAIVYRCHVAATYASCCIFIYTSERSRIEAIDRRTRQSMNTFVNFTNPSFPFEYAILFLPPRYILFLHFRNTFYFLPFGFAGEIDFLNSNWKISKIYRHS